MFGVWWGTFWTTIAAIVAAIAAFAFTRTVGREFVSRKLTGKWEAIDAEIKQGGLFYMFAVRLLPIIPYGLVNFSAGLTSIKFKDYFIGTLLGTLPGVLAVCNDGFWYYSAFPRKYFASNVRFWLDGNIYWRCNLVQTKNF